VRLEEKQFIPTDLGTVVSDQLTDHFTRIMDEGFTAEMEDNLDQVAEGKQDWVKLIDNFIKEFNPTLDQASKYMNSVKGGMSTGVRCPDCGKEMLVKFGKAGPFLACSGYPDCKCTKNFSRDEAGKVKIEEREQQEAQVVGLCPDCGKDLVLKRARTGSRFIACSGYPGCKHAEPWSTGVKCPKCGEGEIVEKSSRRGKIFYSCSSYPKCDYALWDYPVEEACPSCGSPLLVRKNLKAGPVLACPNKECKFKKADE
jgi:DNA topoisomerase-1